MNHVKEVVLFRLNTDADEAAFLKDAQATFDLLAGYDGYIERELTVTEDGLWIDIVTWESMETAHTAAENIMKSAIGQAFGNHIDFESTQMNHSRPRLTGEKAAAS